MIPITLALLTSSIYNRDDNVITAFSRAHLMFSLFTKRCGINEYFMPQVRDSGQWGQVQCSLPLEELDRRGDQLGLQLLPNKVSPHL